MTKQELIEFYASRSEVWFITNYLSGDCDIRVSLSRLRESLTNVKQLPINWRAVYNYFDERYNDDNNRLWDEFYHGLWDIDNVDAKSLVSILNEFRDKLVDDYDMV